MVKGWFKKKKNGRHVTGISGSKYLEELLDLGVRGFEWGSCLMTPKTFEVNTLGAPRAVTWVRQKGGHPLKQ